MSEFKKYLWDSLQWIFFVFSVFVICICIIITFTACSKPCESYTCPEKIINVNIPVPTKCDFYIYSKPEINTSTMQGVYNSITELSLDGVEIRKQLDLIPCLNLIYKDRK